MKKAIIFFGLLALGCEADVTNQSEVAVRAAASGPEAVRKLTEFEYNMTLESVFGAGRFVAVDVEEDAKVKGFTALGHSQASISNLGVERYEVGARQIAASIVTTTVLSEYANCWPASDTESACLQSLVRGLQLPLLRTTLANTVVVDIAESALAAATQSTDAYPGASFVLQTMLQLPQFLFRFEVSDQPTALEIAARISYFLQSGPPDDELVEAVESWSSDDGEALRSVVSAMIDDPKTRLTIRKLFFEILELEKAVNLSRSPEQFPVADASLNKDIIEETLGQIEYIIFDEDLPYSYFITGDTTLVSRRLAALYDITAPVYDGLGRTKQPTDLGRVGFLGQAGFLATQSHPLNTSAVLRGKFVRERLLCNVVPPPAAAVDTGLPEPDETAVTLRQRSEVHASVPECASCHVLMDPIGLTFEHFDAIGQYREKDLGAVIDTSGELDGVPFQGPLELAEAIVQREDYSECLIKHLFQQAAGREPNRADQSFITNLNEYFRANELSVRELLIAMATNQFFHQPRRIEQ